MAPKQGCIVCDIVAGRLPSKKVFEDEKVLAVLDVNGANPGHCFVIPKNHYPIIEQVPDEEIGLIFNTANKVSSAIFETLGAQGTNLFVANGIPAGQTVAHFLVNVIPRRENDGINLQWQPKQLDEEEMSTVEIRLKEQAKNVAYSAALEKKPRLHETPKKHVFIAEGEEDYLSRQMRRLP